MPKAAYHPLLMELHRLGLAAPWQAALLLPSHFEDLRYPIANLAQAPLSQEAFYSLRVDTTPAYRRTGRAPRLVVRLSDDTGDTARGLVFGFFEAFREHLVPGKTVTFLGNAKWMGDVLVIALRAVVPPHWLGRVRPVYPGVPKAASPDDVRERLLALLDIVIEEAAGHLREEVGGDIPEAELCRAVGCPGWVLTDILHQAHRPATPEYGAHAIRALERIASLASLHRAREGRAHGSAARRWSLPTLSARIASLPFALTEDQRTAVHEIAEDLASASPMHRVLCGDVGTGKTAVFGVILAALCGDAGARAIVLLPNEPLAMQVMREFVGWWPDLPIALVTGAASTDFPADTRLFVGTTALNSRSLPSIDLCVIDEQQKFSVHQRTHHVGPGTHLLESTATCIPRSLALAKYGFLAVSTLRQGPHEKRITTTVWSAEQRAALFRTVKATLAAGDQVLVVYPKRDADADGRGLAAVDAGAQQWERQFPGRVRAITGALDDNVKEDALRTMREGRAEILLATSVVEVGINLPKLRQVIVIHPERFGLSTLHQIRGRAAREGGAGRCDLYCPAPIKPEQVERLQALVATQDGFRLAEEDLRLRGFGDMGAGSRRQSGADGTCLVGRPLRPESVESVLPFWQHRTKLAARPSHDP